MKKSDVWTDINQLSIILASLVSVFYCTNESFKIYIYQDEEVHYATELISVALAILSCYGPSYLARKTHIQDQSIDVTSQSEESGSLSELLLPQKNALTLHDRFVLFGVSSINICNGVFPIIFTINTFLSAEKFKYVKMSMLIASTLFGGLAAVSPIRTVKNNLMNSN